MHTIESGDENDSLSSTELVSQLSTAPQEKPSLRKRYVRATLCFMLQAKWTARCPDLKEVQISLQRLNVCSSFISQDERMSESLLEPLQKALGLHLLLKRGLTSF